MSSRSLLYGDIKKASYITDSVIMSFSMGKDSIVAYDLCCQYFKHVYPFFMYLVRGLEFQERTLRWYERKYGNEIIRVPHFENSNLMKYGAYRDYDDNVPITTINDTYDYVRDMTGAEWIADGERITDSIVRRAMIKHSGAIDVKRKVFHPVANWHKDDVLKYIQYKQLYLSREQTKIGFSLASLDGRELSIIHEMYPNDYQKILEIFPFADASRKRFETYFADKEKKK